MGVSTYRKSKNLFVWENPQVLTVFRSLSRISCPLSGFCLEAPNNGRRNQSCCSPSGPNTEHTICLVISWFVQMLFGFPAIEALHVVKFTILFSGPYCFMGVQQPGISLSLLHFPGLPDFEQTPRSRQGHRRIIHDHSSSMTSTGQGQVKGGTKDITSAAHKGPRKPKKSLGSKSPSPSSCWICHWLLLKLQIQ